MSYKVSLPLFEGPFDLLVYLIENARMSIYDIQVSEITEQYLAYIRGMEEMDLNVAAEFMVLAATLIDIKSRMILPRSTEEDVLGEDVDPRSELVERLLEYKRFKELAEGLTVGDVLDQVMASPELQAHREEGYTFNSTVGAVMEMIGVDRVKDILQNKIAESSRIAEYENTRQNVLGYWLRLFLFVIAFAALATITLEFIDKDKR